MKLKQKQNGQVVEMTRAEWEAVGCKAGWRNDRDIRRLARSEQPVSMLVKQHGERTYLVYLNDQFIFAMAHPEGAEELFGGFDELLRNIQDAQVDIQLSTPSS
jgi:hypothetical protein